VRDQLAPVLGVQRVTAPIVQPAAELALPWTAAEAQQRLGLTEVHLFRFRQRDAGSLFDRTFDAELNAGGSPTYAYASQGRRGILYDTAGDYHRGAVLEGGTGSVLLSVAFMLPTLPGDARIIAGRTAGGATPEARYCLTVTAAGLVLFYLADGTDEAIATTSQAVEAGVWYLASGLQDTAANEASVRVSTLADVHDVGTDDSTAIGNLDAVGQMFGFGTQLAGAGHGVALDFALVARGTQVEGLDLQAMHLALGFELEAGGS
jgi:hypothetical protein